MGIGLAVTSMCTFAYVYVLVTVIAILKKLLENIKAE